MAIFTMSIGMQPRGKNKAVYKESHKIHNINHNGESVGQVIEGIKI